MAATVEAPKGSQRAGDYVVSVEDVKGIHRDVMGVLPGLVVVGVNSIKLAARSKGVPEPRRETHDVDFYFPAQMTQKRIAQLGNIDFRPYKKSGPDAFDSQDNINFFKMKRGGREHLVDILQLGAFDCDIDVPGYKLRLQNTQDYIMQGSEVIEGVAIPSMEFVVLIKTAAHINRHLAPGPDVKPSTKHGADIRFILTEILNVTPDEFVKRNYGKLIRHIAKDRESVETIKRVLKSIFEETQEM
ncbi:MAG: hypothetical protein KGH59_02535 [Candidatus Micrarchaeota archaeon]|nr:hypothetical protein [Candidatus Micrarchaeota archaeon]MDE1804634.1 hypothetical protein [Candidatus Micrarchaeota archaeon]MDE1846786.1 hypothetical protein [Candidatus Micrarchaeota archaeon]